MTQSPANDLPDVIDRRYEVVRPLGRGGMAVVCAVHDTLRDRPLALKRMLMGAEQPKNARNRELFEREFSLLSQLAHPRIVQAFDFGHDAGVPYYTMELLEGDDLQRSAPLPWRGACAIARDVCSALSLLHSRRFVHRDVSPRNVYCHAPGTAKLIDFGVIASMGPTKLLVGTPPCTAPESLNLQLLDGRTDLFALGATLYYALVGRHAFAAARFSDLPELWRRGLIRPSAFVADIPRALDDLVLDLLRLEPDARPASAADVIHRLNTIVGAGAADEQLIAAAYLASPPLVGRDSELAHVQGKLKRHVLFEGPSGVGRTRLLDACVLQMTLHGRAVVRCDADDAGSGDFGVARALARRVFEVASEAAHACFDPYREPLSGLLSDPAPGELSRSALQTSLQAWLLAVAERQPLVLAIDDIHRIDEPSAALLLLLAERDPPPGLWLLLTAESGAAWSAQTSRTTLSRVTRIALANLTGAETEKLLRSLFADAPHVERLALRAHALCRGNPRDTLRLAQHCVDRGLAQYASGAWILPEELDPADLPSSLAATLRARIDRLDGPAHRLACALALSPDQSFALQDCATFAREPNAASVHAWSEQLTTRELARWIDGRLTLTHASFIPVLRASLTRSDELALERELATLFQSRSQELRAARHWFRAGEPGRALDILVEHSRTSQEVTSQGSEIFAKYLRALPEDWFDTFEEGLRACDRLNRPHRDKLVLLSRLSGIMPMLSRFAPQHVMALFEMLERACGLRDWAELTGIADPQLRLTAALGRAQARFEAAPDHERVNDVPTALQLLVRSVIGASAGVALSLDLAHLRSWPQLLPFAPLSPSIAIAHALVQGVDARCAGRVPRARALYTELVQRVSDPAQTGMDASHAGYIALGVMNGLGMLDALEGKDSSLAWASRIAGHPNYAINAMSIRAVYLLFQGDVRAAEECMRFAERLRLQNLGRPMYEGQPLIGEVQAYAMAGDATRLRHVQQALSPMAKRFPAWLAVLLYARAEYQRSVGAAQQALRQLDEALELIGAGTHPIWAAVASARLECLLELEQVELATGCSERYVEAAQRELDYLPERLALTSALVRARRADATAGAFADDVIATMKTAGFGKLHLGAAHELRARIALALGERALFEQHEAACRELWSTQQNAALTARCHRLHQAGWRTLHGGQDTDDAVDQGAAARIASMLDRCHDVAECAQLALTLLADFAGATAGALFAPAKPGPQCVAQHGDVSVPEHWSVQVEALLAERAQHAVETVTQTDAQDVLGTMWIDDRGRPFRAFLLAHTEHGALHMTGVAVLSSDEEKELTSPLLAAAAISRYFSALGWRWRSVIVA